MLTFMGRYNRVDKRHILAIAATRISLQADILLHRREDTFSFPFVLISEFSNVDFLAGPKLDHRADDGISSLMFQSLSEQYGHK